MKPYIDQALCFQKKKDTTQLEIVELKDIIIYTKVRTGKNI